MAKCCCCLPLRLGALLIAIWFVIFGVLFGTLSFLNILYGTTASAALIVQGILFILLALVGLFGILCVVWRKTSWMVLFIILAWIMTLACFAMSVINAGLIFWYKDQYLGKCNNQDYLSKYFNVNGDTEEEVLQACQKYFQNVAIGSIITTVILGIMNIAFAVKLTQWLLQTRRDRNEANRVQLEREQREREEAEMASGKPQRQRSFFGRMLGKQNGTQNTAQVGPSMSEAGGPKADVNGANYNSGNAGNAANAGNYNYGNAGNTGNYNTGNANNV